MTEATNEDVVDNVTKTAEKLYAILQRDLPRLQKIDAYLQGIHAGPYIPDNADAEYRMLAKRAVTNHCPLIVETPAQNLYVDGFRRGAKAARVGGAIERRELPEWEHWENSRLNARQTPVVRAAIAYGHAFVATERQASGKIMSKGLSPLRTVALYEDPANDDNAVAALHIKKFAYGSDAEERKKRNGEAVLWDRTNKYTLNFSVEGKWSVVGPKEPHGGAGENPVTRMAPHVDLEGRTIGVIEPFIPLQDRINQTVFDLLIAQTGGSFKTRWATGMAPPLKMAPVYETGADGKPVIDEHGQPVIIDWEPEIDPRTGNPIPAPMNLNAKKFLFAEDPEARFGALDETPLTPYIEAIELAMRQLSSLTQTPPHYLLGQIANLSAEALSAAESALHRKVAELKTCLGESWERVFRIALKLAGDSEWEDMTGQVLWRDMSQQSLAQSADALGKFAESLDIPKRALWTRVPNVTQGEITEWEEAYEEENGQLGGIRNSVPTDLIDEEDREQPEAEREPAGVGGVPPRPGVPGV